VNSAVPRQRLIESITCVALLFAVGADFPIHNWSCPPHFLLPLLPLGLLGLPLAPLLLAAACLVLVLDSRRQRGA